MTSAIDSMVNAGADRDTIMSVVEQALDDNFPDEPVDLDRIAKENTDEVARESGLSGKD